MSSNNLFIPSELFTEYLLGSQTTPATSNISGISYPAGGSVSIAVAVVGTMGTATVDIEGSLDGTDYFTLPVSSMSGSGVSNGNTITATGLYVCPVFSGLSVVRATLSNAGGGTSLTVMGGLSHLPSGFSAMMGGSLTPVPSSTYPGWVPFVSTTNLNTTGFQVKGSSGRLGYVHVVNSDGSNPVYVNVYNSASGATGTPWSLEVAPGWHLETILPLNGVQFTNGIWITLSKDVANTVNPATAITSISGAYV